MTVDTSGSDEYQSKPFYQIWIDAVSKPNLANFTEIVNDPNASLGTALLWLAGVGFLGSLISGTLQSIFGVNAAVYELLGTEYSTTTSFIGVIGGAFGSLIFTPLVAMVIVGLMHLVSRALGGDGSFEKMLFGFAAFWVPISLVNALIGSIPVIGCLSFVLSIYALVLNVFANQAVYGYDTGKAVISSVGVPVLIFVVLFACIIVLVIMGVAVSAPFLENFADQFGMLLFT